MKSVLVTIAPATEAFTSMYSPARSAVSAMTSSVRFPSVALRRPPTESPVLAATDSVAWLRSAASGTMARTERSEQERVPFRYQTLARENHGNEDQKPEEGIVTDFLEQKVHGSPPEREYEPQ